jgi:hypothetical protein
MADPYVPAGAVVSTTGCGEYVGTVLSNAPRVRGRRPDATPRDPAVPPDPETRVRLPDSWTQQYPFLAPLETDWAPVSRAVMTGACAFYGLFILQVLRGTGVLLTMDLVFVPVHEGGHLFFGLFGNEFLAVAGGTLMQLGVPLMLAAYFALQRQVQGVAFCMFFAFEQCLPIATYMADARAQMLPLLTVGDSDDVIHDWNYLFGRVGWLAHDLQIAHVVRVIGWMGMLATVAWMVWRSTQSGPASRATYSIAGRPPE